MFGKHCLKFCSKSVYLAFGVVASLNYSSAGDSNFNHKLTVVILCSSDGIVPRLIRLWLMVFKNSVGCIVLSCVLENSLMLICWLIIGHRKGVVRDVSGGTCGGLDCG